jgi:hypothetical protein
MVAALVVAATFFLAIALLREPEHAYMERGNVVLESSRQQALGANLLARRRDKGTGGARGACTKGLTRGCGRVIIICAYPTPWGEG